MASLDVTAAARMQRFSGVYVAHHNILDVISCTGCFCVGCSNDVAARLQEDSFVTSFPPGWRYMRVWQTSTRQDAELLVHVFRAVCKEYLPGGSSGNCELVSLPLQTIVRVMEQIIARAAASKRILLAHVRVREMCPPASEVAVDLQPSVQSSCATKDSRPLRAHLHYNGGSSVLSPERDNYRFLVLWDELDDSIRLTADDILRDCESWMETSNATKAAATSAAQAAVAEQARAATEARNASRAKAEAEAEAAAKELRNRFLSAQQELQKTQNVLHDMRLRVAALVSKDASYNSHDDVALNVALVEKHSDNDDQIVNQVDSDLSLKTLARSAAKNSQDSELEQSSGRDLQATDLTKQPMNMKLLTNDPHAVAIAYNERRQQLALLSK